MATRLKVAYTEKYLDWQLGEEHPVNPLRAHVVVEELQKVSKLPLEVLTSWAGASTVQKARWLEAARRAQGDGVDQLVSGELGDAVLEMFGGTYTLVDELIRDRAFAGETNVYFNPAGGENSQHEDVDVLNDAVYAVKRLANAGLSVAYVDWDAHHCVETEQLLRDREDILTISVHDRETASTSYSGEGFVNLAVGSGANDIGFVAAAAEAINELNSLEQLDVIVLNAGADGLLEDESSKLQYTAQGLGVAADQLGMFAAERNASVLVLGGGGQLPLDGTPMAWLYVLGMLTNSLMLFSFKETN